MKKQTQCQEKSNQVCRHCLTFLMSAYVEAHLAPRTLVRSCHANWREINFFKELSKTNIIT